MLPVRCAAASRKLLQQRRAPRRRGLHHGCDVGTVLLKGPPGYVPGKIEGAGRNARVTGGGWVSESSRSLSLVHAHPWFGSDSNTEADNLVDCADLFAGRRLAIFGIPAPFTGTCTEVHVPGYQALQDEFVGKVDELICFSVCDPYAMDAWRSSMGVDPTKITFLADTAGKATTAWGLEWDLAEVSLGIRSKRFSMLVEDGEVKAFNLVEDAAADAAVLLAQCSQ
jgi:peroxiredoxin